MSGDILLLEIYLKIVLVVYFSEDNPGKMHHSVVLIFYLWCQALSLFLSSTFWCPLSFKRVVFYTSCRSSHLSYFPDLRLSERIQHAARLICHHMEFRSQDPTSEICTTPFSWYFVCGAKLYRCSCSQRPDAPWALHEHVVLHQSSIICETLSWDLSLDISQTSFLAISSKISHNGHPPWKILLRVIPVNQIII